MGSRLKARETCEAAVQLPRPRGPRRQAPTVKRPNGTGSPAWGPRGGGSLRHVLRARLGPARRHRQCDLCAWVKGGPPRRARKGPDPASWERPGRRGRVIRGGSSAGWVRSNGHVAALRAERVPVLGSCEGPGALALQMGSPSRHLKLRAFRDVMAPRLRSVHEIVGNARSHLSR